MNKWMKSCKAQILTNAFHFFFQKWTEQAPFNISVKDKKFHVSQPVIALPFVPGFMKLLKKFSLENFHQETT